MAETIATIDKWGIDPLTVKAFEDVDNSILSSNTRIDASMEGNPQLLSYKSYSTNRYWNLILIANALIHPSEMVAGQLVTIPQYRPSAAIKQVKRTQI